MRWNEKQQKILLVAEEIFSKKGIDASSIREISKQAKINIAMVSYYFGSKEKLVEALFEMRLEKLNTSLQNLLENESGDSMDKLSSFLQGYLSRILKEHEFHRIMLREYSKTDSPIQIKEGIKKMKLETLRIVQEMIDTGYEQKIFGRRAHAEAIISVVIGSTSYLILNENTYSDKWQIRTHEEYAVYIEDNFYPYLLDSLKAILMYNNEN